MPLLHALYAPEGLIFTAEGERLFDGLRAGDSSTGFGRALENFGPLCGVLINIRTSEIL